MKRDLDTKKRPANREFIERNVAVRAHSRRLCESARELRMIAERARYENMRLRDTNSKLARQVEHLTYIVTPKL